MKKNIVVLFSSFLISIFLLSGCGNSDPAYKNPSNNTSTTAVSTSVSTPIESPAKNLLTSDEEKTWSTYIDKKSSFEFRYHPDMVTVLSPEPGPLNYTAALSFPSSWYVGTNLQNASLGVNVSSSCPNVYPSEEEYAGSLSKTIRNSDNVEFTLDHSDEAAAGNYYKTLLYSAVKNNTCYSVFVNLHSTNRMNYDEANRPKEYDSKKFEEVLAKVVSTFKILK